MEELTLVFNFEGLESSDVIGAIGRIFDRNRISVSDCQLYGKPTEFTPLAAGLKKSCRETFLITVDVFEIDLSSVKHYQFDSLCIKSGQSARIDWDEWIVELMNEQFVLAWVSDVEYEFWQNAEDPLEFEAHGRAWKHLPKRSNGLPPPLDQTVVDTSRNPGRRDLRRGFIEAVGSLMWLGERFWELTGAEKQRVTSAPFLKCTEIASVYFGLNPRHAAFRQTTVQLVIYNES